MLYMSPQLRRSDKIIGIKKRDKLAPSHCHTCITRNRYTLILLMHIENPRIILCQPQHPTPSIIRRAVIDNNRLPILISLRLKAHNGISDISTIVVTRNYYRHQIRLSQLKHSYLYSLPLLIKP